MEINAIILRDEVILERERFLQFQILIWFSVIILLALLSNLWQLAEISYNLRELCTLAIITN